VSDGGHRQLTCAAILLVLLACSDRSATLAVAQAPTPAGPPDVVTERSPVGAVANAIRAAIEVGQTRAREMGARGTEEQLIELYAAGGFIPVWVDSAGRPNRDARDALTLLTDSANEGLDPLDYRAPSLSDLAASLAVSPAPRIADIAAFDSDLSASTLRYLRELHQGRIDPRAMGFRMTVPADTHDFAALLASALVDHRVPQLASDLAPRLALYRALRGALARYRFLAAGTEHQNPRPPAASVRPGQSYAGLDRLRRQLVAFGDLSGDTPLTSSLYEGAMVEAVRRFQARHAIDADGVLGKATLAALDVPLAWRVRQIELALERLRWLPDIGDDRFIAVNIPMFRLWGWDSIVPNGAPSFSMGVIVGRALNTQTPVFVEDMRYIIFRPYWNVPTTIMRGEILPALRRDHDYLDRQNMEIVSGRGDDARPVVVTAESLAELRGGRLRVHQRPGPKNALGLVKFVFPNDANVYLHDTPSPQLFRRPRRDFSHGCVRVEDPVALAEWALKGQPEWTRDRILATMNGHQSRRVDLVRPIRIILFYITAVVMPEDGAIHFADDIYGHDARLDRALAHDQTSH
jgi:murein L,D-transpeptidase YcbB/YkuD